MKKLISTRGLFILALLIVIISNVVMFAFVFFNKSNITSQITLTERELKLPRLPRKENSGLSLQLVHSSLSPGWLNDEKLVELGFNGIDDYENTQNYTKRRRATKEVFIVLEYNGDTYKELVEKSERRLKEATDLLNLNLGTGDKCVSDNPLFCDDNNLRKNVNLAKKSLENRSKIYSRLFAIDAGVNPEKLRKKYDDKTQFMIVKGLIVVNFWQQDNKNYIQKRIKLSIRHIHVPLEYRKALSISPYYNVELIYGSRYEPWIKSLQPRTN